MAGTHWREDAFWPGHDDVIKTTFFGEGVS